MPAHVEMLIAEKTSSAANTRGGISVESWHPRMNLDMTVQTPHFRDVPKPA